MDFAEELLLKLGGIEANLKNLNERVVVIDDTAKRLLIQDTKQEGKLTAIHDRMDKTEPIVQRHEDMVNRGLGIIGFVSFLMGVFGSFIAQLFFGKAE